MHDPNAPVDVRVGAIFLSTIALVLADMQSGKKSGLTNALLRTLRKQKGFTEADEGTLLGVLCAGACASLGAGGLKEIVEHPEAWGGYIKASVNALSYPAGAMFDFKHTRSLANRWLGGKLRLSHQDEQGTLRHAENTIDLGRVAQQLAFLSGATGLYAYGQVIDVSAAQFTGLMFMLSNGLGAGLQLSQPLQGEWLTQAEQLAKEVSKIQDSDDLTPDLRRRLAEAYESYKASGVEATDSSVSEALQSVLAEIKSALSQEGHRGVAQRQ